MTELGIDEVPITPRSRWQNPYVERLIGTIRRECLNHVIVLNEAYLTRILRDYFEYYHTARTHQSLENNAPWPREVEPPERPNVDASLPTRWWADSIIATAVSPRSLNPPRRTPRVTGQVHNTPKIASSGNALTIAVAVFLNG
jgi:hypothetical protein